MTLREEIFEQPGCVERLLRTQESKVRDIAGAMRSDDPCFVLLVARGSSDNAAVYAKYVLGAQNGLPVALAAPSLFSVYERPLRLRRTWVVALSQSGESPDLTAVVDSARAQGAPTLAITNSEKSPLARAAEHVLDISAGPEHAVAATKSYTAQLVAIAMLSAALSEEQAAFDALARVPAVIADALGREEHIGHVARQLSPMQRNVVLGRGYDYATAFELALKLKEVARVQSEPYSTADFLHGPISVVDPGFPVIAIAPQGVNTPHALSLLSRLGDLAASRVVLSDHGETLKHAEFPITIPAAPRPWLSPMSTIVIGQLLVHHLAQAAGFDPDAPRGLQKVTRTL